jgi:iron complex transport system permease protein
MDRKTLAAPITIAGVTLVMVLLVTPLIGSATVDFRAAIEGISPHREILFAARLPRVLLAAIAGGALAVAGLVFQALVRDSLADPYTLGVSAGSSLGAVVAICFRLHMALGMPAVGAAALVGASTVLVMVMALASRGKSLSSFTLLLAGVTMNSLSIAMILFLHNLADFGQSFAIVRWLMGGIESEPFSRLAFLAAIVVATVLVLFRYARVWNLLSVGEEWAEARGTPAAPSLRLGFVAGSVLTAMVTAFTGPIGFLGWIIPHALRLRYGADHRLLIPCAFLYGAAFLAMCDTVARTLLAPTEIPVGVITAMTGGPFFLWMLGSRARRVL